MDCKECTQIREREKRKKKSKGRKHHYVEIYGEIKTVAEWSKICGVRHDVLLKRIKNGYSGTELLQKEIQIHKDIARMKFNSLTAIERVENDKNGNAMWLFSCECGNKKIMKGSTVSNGYIKSCGCLLKMANKDKNIKHGYSRAGKKERIYETWARMKSRCYNSKTKRFEDYGGRGITVCDEWLDKERGFMNFYNWSMANGYAKNLTIDRIDVNGNYEPSNCRWATDIEQNRNRRNTIKVEIEGRIVTLAELASQHDLSYSTIWYRYKNGPRGMELFQPKMK